MFYFFNANFFLFKVFPIFRSPDVNIVNIHIHWHEYNKKSNQLTTYTQETQQFFKSQLHVCQLLMRQKLIYYYKSQNHETQGKKT